MANTRILHGLAIAIMSIVISPSLQAQWQMITSSVKCTIDNVNGPCYLLTSNFQYSYTFVAYAACLNCSIGGTALVSAYVQEPIRAAGHACAETCARAVDGIKIEPLGSG